MLNWAVFTLCSTMLNWALHTVLHNVKLGRFHTVLHNVKLGAVWKRPNLKLWSTVCKHPNFKLWSTVWKRPYLILWSTDVKTAQFNIVGAHCKSIVIHNVRTPQFYIVEHTVNLSLFTMWKRPNLTLWSHYDLQCDSHCEIHNVTTLWIYRYSQCENAPI